MDPCLSLTSIFLNRSGKTSDKWALYVREYERLFSPLRSLPIRLLEIGIQNGGSLEIWNAFFPAAVKIVGCDVNPECAQLQYPDSAISVVVCDANTDDAQRQISAFAPAFDVILDDGSHKSSDIVRSFVRYFRQLAYGGIYIVEDLHCSYWKEFEGGLNFPYSAMAFFRLLTDVLNHEHWGLDRTRESLLGGMETEYEVQFDELLLGEIHSIEFVNSMCIVRKAPVEENVLGKRWVTGNSAIVDTQPLDFAGTLSAAITQDVPAGGGEAAVGAHEVQSAITLLSRAIQQQSKDWALLKRELLGREQEISRLAQAEQELAAVRSSAEQHEFHRNENARLLEQSRVDLRECLASVAEMQREAAAVRSTHASAQEKHNAEVEQLRGMMTAAASQHEQRLAELTRGVGQLTQVLQVERVEHAQLQADRARRDEEREHTDRMQYAEANASFASQLDAFAGNQNKLLSQLDGNAREQERLRLEHEQELAGSEHAWTHRLRVAEAEVIELRRAHAEEVEGLARRVSELNSQVQGVQSSRSWKLTAPLRFLARHLRLQTGTKEIFETDRKPE
jgi:O-antigen biosynthesis protein